MTHEHARVGHQDPIITERVNVIKTRQWDQGRFYLSSNDGEQKKATASTHGVMGRMLHGHQHTAQPLKSRSSPSPVALVGATTTTALTANSWLYINKCHMYGANNHTTHNAIWHLRHKLEGLLSAVHWTRTRSCDRCTGVLFKKYIYTGVAQ